MEELKPCPFCGKDHEIDIDEDGGVAFVHKGFDWTKDECLLCIQELDYPTKIEHFVKTWNTRLIEDALTATIAQKDAEIERLRGVLKEIVDRRYPGASYIAKKGLEVE